MRSSANVPFPGRAAQVHSNRGSILIVALILCAVIAISLVSYYRLASSALKGANRSLLSFSNINVVEMGVERSMACLYQVSTGVAAATAWSGWTLNSGTNEATTTFPSSSTYFTVGPNTRAQVKVYVRNYTGSGGQPVIVAKSIITPPDGPTMSKFVEVTLTNRSLWGYGMVGRTWVHMNSNARADSWISDQDGNPGTAGVAYSSALRRDNGTVGTVSSANGAIAMDSNAEIYGTANTGGGTVSTNSNVRIYSATSPGTPKVDPSRVHTDFTFTFPPITTPTVTPITLSTTMTGGSSASPQVLPRLGDAAVGGKFYYRFATGKNINMDSNKYISITDSVVLIFDNHAGFDAIHTSSNANINVTAGKTLEIYTNGNLTLDSNNNLNVGNEAKNLTIYGTNPTSQTFTLSSNVTIYGTIYAPNATYRIDSNCNLYGAVIANTIQMDSNAAFHYDESLAGAGTGSGFRVSKWKELQTASERATYAAALNF
ncbi:MAG: hypothetical protein HZA93_20590 [Verrucomicrobia bacterium]|nr:hypothetical protein [Verrucomicrobiota bacterium]